MKIKGVVLKVLGSSTSLTRGREWTRDSIEFLNIKSGARVLIDSFCGFTDKELSGDVVTIKCEFYGVDDRTAKYTKKRSRTIPYTATEDYQNNLWK